MRERCKVDPRQGRVTDHILNHVARQIAAGPDPFYFDLRARQELRQIGAIQNMPEAEGAILACDGRTGINLVIDNHLILFYAVSKGLHLCAAVNDLCSR